MPKTKISEWSSTPANNTDIDSINIAEGCAPSGINDAIRELMSQVKDLYSGTTGDVISVAGGGTGIGTLTGLVKGNGTSAFSAATSGTDYVTPTGTETLTNKTLTAPIIDNPKLGYTTTATAAGTTTLTVTSNHQQFFTGTTTQTIVLPVTSTLVLGMGYSIENNSTGVLTVQSSGLNSITTIPAGVTTLFTCILTSGTTAASWDYDQIGFATITGTGANVLGTAPTIASANLTTALTLTGASCTSGQVLTSGGSGAAPTWTTVSGGSSQWTTTGSNIYYNTGNVSIGNTSPQTSFQVSGTGTASGGNAAASGYAALMLSDTTNSETYIHSVRPSVGWNNLNFGALTYTWRTNGGNVGMTFNSSNNLQLLNSLSVGNATPTTSGAGITFPATQSASSNANTLDDYEEGTWSPVITGSSGAGTYNDQSGTYVKVGKLVVVNFQIALSTKNTLSGDITLSNLPFTTADNGGGGYRPSPAIRTTNLVSVTGTVGGFALVNSTNLQLQIYNNGGSSNLNASNLPTSSFEIGGSLSYIAN